MVLSLSISAVDQNPVMAVARVGIERHVADDADLRHLLLDGTHGAADEIAGIERLARAVVAQRSVGIGKQSDGRKPECRRLFRRLDGEVDRQPLHPRHGGNGGARPRPFDKEDRPDQIVNRERAFAHEPPRPVCPPIAPHARRGETGACRVLRLAAAGTLRPLGAQRDCLVLRGCHVLLPDRLKLAASYHPGGKAPMRHPRHGLQFLAGAYSQMAERRRAFMSKWKWSLWASLASGPSTVPKVRQASSCTAFTNAPLRSGCD